MIPGQITTKADAEKIVRPHAPALSGAIFGALDDWRALLQDNPTPTAGLSTRTQNSYIHDRIVFRLSSLWSENPNGGLRMTRVNGLHVAILNDAVMLKLKKLNVKLRSRNVPTGQTAAFDNQRQLLDGSLLTNATSGYILDAAKSVNRAVVVCWEGDQQHWAVDLLNNAADAAHLFELPASRAPSNRKRTKVVKPTAKPVATDS